MARKVDSGAAPPLRVRQFRMLAEYADIASPNQTAMNITATLYAFQRSEESDPPWRPPKSDPRINRIEGIADQRTGFVAESEPSRVPRRPPGHFDHREKRMRLNLTIQVARAYLYGRNR